MYLWFYRSFRAFPGGPGTGFSAITFFRNYWQVFQPDHAGARRGYSHQDNFFWLPAHFGSKPI